MHQHASMSFSKPFLFSPHFIIFFMSCMIFLPSFYEHDDFIEDNEEFKLRGEELETLHNF